MSTIVILGASGPVGQRLMPRLAGHRLVPVSRRPRGDGWMQGDLGDPQANWPQPDIAISLGPLDLFARAIERSPLLPLRRVIALSSMSAEAKRESIDAGEREVAQRLRSAEDTLKRCASERNFALTIFRSTLIYGSGTDQNVGRLARFVKKWHFMVIPLGATGLRQPVHADDLAIATATVLDQPQTYGRTYEMGGGERIPAVDMFRRVRKATPVWSVPIPVPVSVITGLIRHWHGDHPALAAFARARADLIADIDPARRDFGYAPREFIAADASPRFTPR